MITYSCISYCWLKLVKETESIQLTTLWWRHNDHDSVSNHQPHECLLNRLFRRRSKKTSKLRVTGLCVGNSPGPVNSPHKGPVKRKMFPFDDVIMILARKKTNSYVRVFQNSYFFCCIVAFYSPMMHAKRNTCAKFQQNRCGLGPPVRHFPVLAWRARKTPYLLYIKNPNCLRALQVGSFYGEWRGGQMS